MRISYVNGNYVPHREAMVNVEDRGYQFSDGIYEYIAFYNRKLLDAIPHFMRLERSLGELKIIMPVTPAALTVIARELIERNGREDGGLYIQVTRGVARRDHAFPKNTKASLVMTVCAAKLPKQQEIKKGVKVITCPEIRWARRDIKSISLLGNILAKQEAAKLQTREAWFVENEAVTEGSASNAYIISKSGELITHPATHAILGGIVRDVILKLAHDAGIKVDERPFSMHEVAAAAEAFITSTSANILPVMQVDDMVIASGVPGPITEKLYELYARHVFKQTGKKL